MTYSQYPYVEAFVDQKEYDNLIESQSVSTIYLTVQKLEGDALDASIQAEAVDEEEESETE